MPTPIDRDISLNERLGYSPEAKLVILSCDDLGSCHAANEGVYQALREGSATCTSLMVPAPWARHAAEQYSGDDVGVHLTLNAEHARYRWGPLTHAPRCSPATVVSRRRSTTSGSMPIPMRSAASCVHRSNAPWRGGSTSPTSLPTSHRSRCGPSSSTSTSSSPSTSPCPIRLPSTISEERAGFPFRRLAAEDAVVFPDHFDHDWRPGSRLRTFAALDSLSAGVTEIHIQPAIDTPEVRALTPYAEAWIDDLALALDPDLAGANRRRRRDADRVPRPQGCDARRLSASATSPARNSSKNTPVDPVVFSRPRM